MGANTLKTIGAMGAMNRTIAGTTSTDEVELTIGDQTKKEDTDEAYHFDEPACPSTGTYSDNIIANDPVSG